MAFRASWMARCIIAYIRDSWNGSSRGAIHAFVAATPACAFQALTASPPAGAANAARDSGETRPGDRVNTPARRVITRTTGSCTRITHLIFMASSLLIRYRTDSDQLLTKHQPGDFYFNASSEGFVTKYLAATNSPIFFPMAIPTSVEFRYCTPS